MIKKRTQQYLIFFTNNKTSGSKTVSLLLEKCIQYSLQFLEPLKASSDVLGSRPKVLEVCDPVALPRGVQGPDGELGTDVVGHLVQKSLHGAHLSLVDHEPPSTVEGVTIPVHHHVLHRR